MSENVHHTFQESQATCLKVLFYLTDSPEPKDIYFTNTEVYKKLANIHI